MVNLYFLAVALLLLPYVLLITAFIFGWRKNTRPSAASPEKIRKPFVSVVVAFRNEENNLPALLKHIQAQNYPSHLFEVLLCDDFSEDQSAFICQTFTRKNKNFRLISLMADGQHGKKAALKRGIEQAAGDIIITTDADCSMGSKWLESIVHPFIYSNIEFLAGPVKIITDPKNKLFSGMQALEFMSLTGASAGAAGITHPIMCNGANLAFRKKGWAELIHDVSGKKLASGDDVFLLHAFQKKYPGKIIFLKDRKAIVSTRAANSLKMFFSQRMRWAGKSTGYSDIFTLFTGFVVAALNIFLVVSLLAALFNPFLLLPLAAMWLAKIVVDFILLFRVAGFLKQKKLLFLYLPLALLYPIYVSTTIFLAIFAGNAWKSRKL